MYKKEGGKSRALTDSASKNFCPVPHTDGYKYHTNKGVQWVTFVSLASKCGYDPTPANFYKMPHSIWGKIMKVGFWDVWDLDKMRSIRLAILCSSWIWGSGPGGAERQMANFIREVWNVDDNDITPSEIVKHFNKRPWAILHFNKLCKRRGEFFRSLNQPANLNGWLNRLEDFRKTFRPKFFII